MNHNKTILSVRDLTVSYGSIKAVKGIFGSTKAAGAT